MTKQQASIGSEWRKTREEGVLITLPSGKVIRMRPINLDTIVKLGYVPNAISKVILDAMAGIDGTIETPESEDDLAEFVQYYDSVCQTCFMEPRIVDKPVNDDEIHLDDLSLEDKQFVASFVNTPAAELQEFRLQQETNLESLGHEQVVLSETESTD